MSLRFKSLDDLGAGAWRVASSTPLKPPSTRSKAKKRWSGPTPHDILWAAVSARWPQAVREFAGAVPGRRFRLDIGFETERICVEVDGYEFHGKHLGDFKRDRERQNLLVTTGWKVLRFTASDIRQQIDVCMATIEAALEAAQSHLRGARTDDPPFA